MRIKKTAVILGLIGLLAVLWGCGKNNAGENNGENVNSQNNGVTQVVLTTGFDRDEVFRIGKSTCKLDEFMVYLTNIQNRYESVYGSQLWSVSSNGISMESRIKDNVAARIAQVKTMNLLAEEYQVTLTEEEQKQTAAAAQEYYTSLNQTEIEAMGASKELIEKLFSEYLIAHKVYAYIIRDINPEISDDEARSVTVDWIFLKSEEESGEIEKLARDIKNRLNAGEDFYTLAAAYSDDKTVTHSFGKGVMDQAVEECAFNLATDETSDVIKGTDGYYVIHCVNTLDRKETDANKEKIITQRKKEAFNEVYGTFAEKQVRQLNEGLWDQISLVHNSQVGTSTFFDIYEKYFPKQ